MITIIVEKVLISKTLVIKRNWSFLIVCPKTSIWTTMSGISNQKVFPLPLIICQIRIFIIKNLLIEF